MVGKAAVVAVAAAVASLAAPTGGAFCSRCSGQLSFEYVEEVKALVRDMLYDLPQGLTESRQRVPLDRAIGGAVRVAFHDMGTYNKTDKTGRANGCFLMDDAGNGGLSVMAAELAALYSTMDRAESFSRADFFQLASMVAVEESHKIAVEKFGSQVPPLPDPYANLKYGRQDVSCPVSSLATETFDTEAQIERNRLPAPSGAFDHVKEVMIDRMGLTVEEVVALMGAHTLGKSTADGSGLIGSWTVEPAALDNSYYVTLLDENLTRVFIDNDDSKPQWNTTEQDVFMLTSDVCLAHRVRSLELGCSRIPRPPGDCEPNTEGEPLESRQFVEIYAGGVERNATQGLIDWYAAFIPALIRMSNLGYEDVLEEPCELPPICQNGVQGPEGANRTTVDFTILMDEKFKPEYHGQRGFAELLRERVAQAFGLVIEQVTVKDVRAGSVIADVQLILDTEIDIQVLKMMAADNVVRGVLQKTIEAEVAANLMGPIKLVRVTDNNFSKPVVVQPSIIGPFQSEKIDKRTALLGTSLTAVFVTLLSACFMCVARANDTLDEIEDVEQKARQQRKLDRLNVLAPREFSTAANDLAFDATLDAAADSSDDSDGYVRRRKRDKSRKKNRKAKRSRSRSRSSTRR